MSYWQRELRLPFGSAIPENHVVGDRVEIPLDPGMCRPVRGALSRFSNRIEFYGYQAQGAAIGDLNRMMLTDCFGKRRRFVDFKTVMSRVDLVNKLRANRAQHAKMFEEARGGYCTAAAEACDKLIAEFDAGKAVAIQVPLVPPEDHTEDYDRIIRMLECTKQEEITLDEEQFSCYVDDDWGWLKRWLHGNRRFSPTAGEYALAKKL